MNTTTTTTTLPVNLYDITAFQILRLVSSSDLDASEFGTRFTKYLALVARNYRTDREQAEMANLLEMLVNDYSNPAFREHLSGVL